jgi:hypothetical protein
LTIASHRKRRKEQLGRAILMSVIVLSAVVLVGLAPRVKSPPNSCDDAGARCSDRDCSRFY